MKKYLKILLLFLLPVFSTAQQAVPGREIFFNKVPPPDGKTFVHVTGISQDKNGYIWLSTKKGLCRYDGYEMITYKNNPLDPNSLATNILESICVDSTGIIWIGTAGAGLERFDPSTGLFKHFRYSPKDPGSISADWVSAVMIDREGILWTGTGDGLDRYNAATGEFTHFRNIPGDSTSISSNEVTTVYEDRQGSIWIGTGSIYGADKSIKESGGLNRMNKKTGTFTRFMHDPHNPNSLINNKVRAIFEDSNGTFWVGTAGDGLHTMDRRTGTFVRHQFDPANPDKLSRPSISQEYPHTDHITFIREDVAGGIWIGTSESGVNRYNPTTTRITHYENEKEVDGAFAERTAWWAYTSRDGVLWISTLFGNLYRIDLLRKEIPHYTLTEGAVNCFYQEPNGILWLGTYKGIVRKDTNNVTLPWSNLEKPLSEIAENWTSVIKEDDRGNLWIGGVGGLNHWNKKTGQLITYLNRENKYTLGNAITAAHEESDGKICLGTAMGISFLDPKTGSFTQSLLNPDDTTLFGQNFVTVLPDKKGRLWVGSMAGGGLNLFDRDKGTFKEYLDVYQVNCIFEDVDSVVWVGTDDGLYYYDRVSDRFVRYTDLNTLSEISSVSSIAQDNQHHLWLATANGIIKIDARRNETSVYGKNYGVGEIKYSFNFSYKGLHGEIYFGDATGYYIFDPKELTNNVRPPEIIITAFSLGDQIVKPGNHSPLKESLSQVKEIRLRYDQNVFSFDFTAIDYTNPEANQHLVMLENYDNGWHQANAEHRAYYFNIPPGRYIFKIKAANSYGVWNEKKIEVTLMPPWWRTWWAYTLFVILFLAVIWAIIYYRSRRLRLENKILEEKVSQRTTQLQQSLENLKSTQALLIQSEKMASLGELTAGIAHEIQNPLNFVNNFSEVNKELLIEMKDELDQGHLQEAKSIANDVIENQEKINHHGKRADAIVKGMLQHSRSSSSVKEPTNINALADEYLRLAYHGLRAKDKSFNATMKTDFDETIGKINIVPQDIGRVILNLITNAFYACNERVNGERLTVNGELPANSERRTANGDYNPTVTVTTKNLGDKVEIRVKDNGNGIPEKTIDKIFQPFFTTKPVGQGTGLGLSISYDIIKAHGGELKVSSEEGIGTIFSIYLAA